MLKMSRNIVEIWAILLICISFFRLSQHPLHRVSWPRRRCYSIRKHRGLGIRSLPVGVGFFTFWCSTLVDVVYRKIFHLEHGRLSEWCSRSWTVFSFTYVEGSILHKKGMILSARFWISAFSIRCYPACTETRVTLQNEAIEEVSWFPLRQAVLRKHSVPHGRAAAFFQLPLPISGSKRGHRLV